MRIEMTKEQALQEIKDQKYTGRCYLEIYRGGDRVFVADVGSKQAIEADDLCTSSSRWTFIGEFKNGDGIDTEKSCVKMKYKLEYCDGYYITKNGKVAINFAEDADEAFAKLVINALQPERKNLGFWCACNEKNIVKDSHTCVVCHKPIKKVKK